MDIRKRHEDNRRAWSEAAEVYMQDLDDRIAFLKAGGTNFCESERPHLARIVPGCQRAIHLQCAGGTDTISLWNLGIPEVIGVDISDRMIEVARKKSEAVGANASWIRSDILDTPAELDGTADLVYTGRGAICWIMDIEAWAAVVARLLRPGGVLFLFEGHPVTWLFDLNAAEPKLDPNPPFGDYFATEIGEEKGWPTTYVGDVLTEAEDLSVKHERQWNLGQVVNALIGAGLQIERLDEYPELYWETFPNWTPELRAKIPQTFSVIARKPI
ncbi:MAG: class I SAM-dependent methyltransferase [Fimbriimonas sp.]